MRIVHDFAEPCRLKPLRLIPGPLWRAAAAKPGSYVTEKPPGPNMACVQSHLRFAGMAIADLKSERRGCPELDATTVRLLVLPFNTSLSGRPDS